MRLQCLEIKGFKSFADEVTFHFTNNTTGIVGPNGCGKSNIVDSIRWVVGEQKISNLRSTNLENLVFNGSKKRPASSLAEVSLTFEKTQNIISPDYDSVKITRRYYKNGESEYRINDVLCKHKDIQSLLIDTGISSDSYAIIELGMIDDLIRNKENARKKMLEQAAGISLFKIRKKESEQKLNLTDTDLSRIEDLLFEINSQLKIVESQAKKTEKYKKIKTEYKTLFFDYINLSVKEKNQSFRLNQELIKDLEETLNPIIVSIRSEEATIEENKNTLIDKEHTLKSEQEHFNSLKDEINEKEKNKTLKIQKITYEEQKIEQYNATISNNSTSIKELKKHDTQNHQELETLQSTLKNLNTKKNTLENEANATSESLTDEENKLETLNNKLKKIESEIKEVEKNIAITENNITNSQNEIQRLEQENTSLLKNLETKEIEKKDLKKTIQHLSGELTIIQKKHEKIHNKRKEVQNKTNEIKDDIYEANRVLDSCKNEYNLIKSMVDNMEGYPDSMRYLRNTPHWSKQFPILSDILEVKDEYKITLENFLEPYLNYFIVNTIKDAKQGIELLISSQKGKSSFFISTLFENNEKATKITINEPNIIKAIDLVNIKTPYQNIINHLLNNVFVAEATDIERLEKKFNTCVFLEKNGNFLKKRNALIGGSIGLFEGNKIGRVKKMETLSSNIKKYESIVNELNNHLQQQKKSLVSIEQQQQQITSDETNDELNNLSNKIIATENSIFHTKDTINKNKKITENLLSNLEKHNKQKQNYELDLNAKKSSLRELQQKRNNQFEIFNQIRENSFGKEKEINKHTLHLSQHKAKIENLNNKISYNQNQIKYFEHQNQDIIQKIEKLGEQKNNDQNLINELETEHEELLKKYSSFQKKLHNIEQEYQHFKHLIKEKEGIIKSLYIDKEKIETKLSEAKEKMSESKLSLASVQERLSIEFNTSLEKIENIPIKTELKLNNLEQKIDDLRKKIMNLGEVNPSALEAFEEINERKKMIEEQRDDLLKAKKDLIKTINEVETKANASFLETFNKVRDNFKHVFKKLFSEDDECDLILSDPNDISSTNVEIIAKPKGKRPSNISQLSGGEKSLTAVSLLFSFYLIKPAPFCIFDEVDAPLDDNNVLKFNKMIKEFSKNSQFIVVTHNKFTMLAMEKIYGITMQEEGVSKLVPVAFQELDDIKLKA